MRPLLLALFFILGIMVSHVPVTAQPANQPLFKMMLTDNYRPAQSEQPLVKKKSIWTGIGLSAVIPGAGEIYAGRYLRGATFVAIEAAGWWAYLHFDKKGDDIEKEFRRYADSYWDEEEYRNAIESGYVPRYGHSHTLPEIHTQQYYEMIGKYNQFVEWWEDFDSDAAQSQRRLRYEDRRYEHNKNLKRSRLGGSVIFLNRFASLIDTIWVLTKGSHSEERRISISSVRRMYGVEPVQYFTLAVRW